MYVQPPPQTWPEPIQPKKLPRAEGDKQDGPPAVAEKKHGDARAGQRDRTASDRRRKPAPDPDRPVARQDVVQTGYGYAAAPPHKINTVT